MRIRRLCPFLACLLLTFTFLPLLPATAEGGPENDPDVVAHDADCDLTRNMRLTTEQTITTGTCYYVSADGDDKQDGMSEDTAFASFAPINRLVLEPGDCVLLRRGDVWHERLTIRGQGREDAWIFVGSYGDLKKPSPEISLSNHRDDVALLVSDITGADPASCGFAYVWIDSLTISHSTVGIYFRAAVTSDNTGIRVTNCSFRNIQCLELMDELMQTYDWLGKPKGHLPVIRGGRVEPEGGGVYEYVYPAAINFGGRPQTAMAGVSVPGRAEPTVRMSQIELYQDDFEDCVMCVNASAYFIHYGAGPNQCYTYTKDWRVKGLTSRSCMTLLSIDSATFGYDGTPESRFGIFENCLALSGMEEVTSTTGTTQAMFSCCRDLLIRNSQFNGCRNNGQADGCGFDFERGVFNFTLENCVFAANEGQPVLMMQTTMEDQVTHTMVTTENADCTLKNCLFYDNFRRVFNENYRFSFQMFNAQNRNIRLDGCAFYERKRTQGAAEIGINQGPTKSLRMVGPETAGVTVTDEVLVSKNTLPALSELMSTHGLDDATLAFAPVSKVWTAYVGEILPETEPATEQVTEPETLTEADTQTPATAEDTTTPAAETTPGTTESGTSGYSSKLGAVAAAVTACAAAAGFGIRKRKDD